MYLLYTVTLIGRRQRLGKAQCCGKRSSPSPRPYSGTYALRPCDRYLRTTTSRTRKSEHLGCYYSQVDRNLKDLRVTATLATRFTPPRRETNANDPLQPVQGIRGIESSSRRDKYLGLCGLLCKCNNPIFVPPFHQNKTTSSLFTSRDAQ